MSDYQITTFTNGNLQQNCYVVVNNLQEALIIDPGSKPEAISNLLDDLKVIPIAILNTHAHYDHIGAVSTLLQKYSMPFFLHKDDAKLLKQANIYKIMFGSKDSIPIPSFGEDLADIKKKQVLLGFKIQAIHTPGHTGGSVCLLIGDQLFSGDTLLPWGAGRTDLPGGDSQKLKDSLEILRRLPDRYLVYPGHGKPFTLEEFWNRNDL
jgi:glyoxylase-like metal-dependent hydrolase (beta-lactamase superfamily II)